MNGTSSGKGNATRIAIIGSFMIAIIMVLGTFWIVQSARDDNEEAVRAVSLLYLNELAGRREQVVENNLQNKIRDLQIAVGLMTDEDLSDIEHLQAYQARMKKLYTLEKFAFVDESGLIYTSLGNQNNIDEYDIDYMNISEAEISILNVNSPEKKVIIAVPVDLDFEDVKFKVCFMEIDMQEMLSGVSMESADEDATFCNIYTRNGVSLANTVLGGSASENDLFEAMKNAEFDDVYTYERFIEEFENGTGGEVSFSYNGVNETLSYVPVDGTDWNLTYLIKESVISDKITSISSGMIIRGIIQSVITVLAMAAMFVFILTATRRSTRLQIESETAQAELRGKEAELDRRLALQKQLEHQSQALSDALSSQAERETKSSIYRNFAPSAGAVIVYI